MIDKDIIKKLIDEELADANTVKNWFVDDHQAYAVIREELEETSHEYVELWDIEDEFWKKVKADENVVEVSRKGYERAITLIQEAIQVAAMFKKAADSESWRESTANNLIATLAENKGKEEGALVEFILEEVAKQCTGKMSI